ncbi:MAG TPA: DUF1674 domain-containing protein [Steroidobacteraceae bacterium]|jgi:hypothetical protein|nr:DUF1674 domain-containing protein [Steroidobacteraceae bacterium]
MSTFTCKSPEPHPPAEVSAPSAEDPAHAARAIEPAAGARRAAAAAQGTAAREIGGVAGPEPTRFGDWEKNGRCIDF